MVDIPDSTFLKANFNEKIETNDANFLDDDSEPMDRLLFSGSESATAVLNNEQFFDATDEPIVDSAMGAGKFCLGIILKE